MEKQRMKTFRMVFLAMMVAIGVVISPILRIEGMCPTAHLINITCSVFMGPWYSLLCACMIGVIRMMFMGIPPLALTGAVFGAFLSGVFYRASKGKIICAVFGEIFGTGIIGSLVSYPVMAFLMGREGLNAFYYTPMFISATIMGGIAAYVFLKALSQTGMLANQPSLMHKMSPDYLIYFGVKYHRQCSYFLTQYGMNNDYSETFYHGILLAAKCVIKGCRMKGDTETATKIENLIDEMPSTLRGDQPC